jgi:hypothetical protein
MTSGIIATTNDNTKGKNLNANARDLLQLLSLDPNNREAASLLRAVQYEHGEEGWDAVKFHDRWIACVL